MTSATCGSTFFNAVLLRVFVQVWWRSRRRVSLMGAGESLVGTTTRSWTRARARSPRRVGEVAGVAPTDKCDPGIASSRRGNATWWEPGWDDPAPTLASDRKPAEVGEDVCGTSSPTPRACRWATARAARLRHDCRLQSASSIHVGRRQMAQSTACSLTATLRAGTAPQGCSRSRACRSQPPIEPVSGTTTRTRPHRA